MAGRQDVDSSVDTALELIIAHDTITSRHDAGATKSPTWPRARLWSRRVRQVMFSAGMEGAFSFRISAFVFAGLATTSTCEAFRWG